MGCYKINIENQLRCLTPFLLGTIFLIFIYFLTDIPLFGIVSIFYVLSGVIPIFLTHVHYLIKNRNVTLKVDFNNQIF